MKKKILALVLIVALVASLAVALVACDNTDKDNNTVVSFKPIAKENIKFGLIALHDENSTYDKNFIDAAKNAIKACGLSDSQLVIKTSIPESNACYEAAIELVDQGCNIIFADSFGHESYLLQAAKENPSVRFAHATGTTAHTELQANFYNAFASIYEGRYLAGVAAGLKLLESKPDATSYKMGYVGAYTYAEVISGYTSFYLGAKSVIEEAGKTVTMDVTFTGSWYDEAAEKNAAISLIDPKGATKADLVSQHADSMGAPIACEERGIPNVTYNISTKSACPDTYVIGSRVNWEPYFEYLINCTINGVTAVGFDWCGGLGNNPENYLVGGSVEVLEIGTAAAAGTAEKLAEVAAQLKAGTLNVFDTANFTVDGKTLTECLADVDTDANYEKDTQVVLNGVFLESVYRSAPYFDLKIDGITLLNTAL